MACAESPTELREMPGRSTAVFNGHLWASRPAKGGRCEVSSYRLGGSADNYSAVPAKKQLVVAPGCGDCELVRVCDWSSSLEVLVLRAGQTVHAWDPESDTFKTLSENAASSCAVLDGPTLASLSPRRLLLEPLPPLDAPRTVVTLTEPESARSVLTGASFQVSVTKEDPGQEVRWVLLCVLALEEGVGFFAVSGGHVTQVASSLFLGSLYEKSCVTACCVRLPATASVSSLDHLQAAFRDNVTVACTVSGSVLVVCSGQPQCRCQLPCANVVRLQGSFSWGSLDFVVVWPSSGGALVVRRESGCKLEVGDCIEAGLEVSCGDALGLGCEQVLTWEPASGQIRCLQPGQSVVAEEVAASGGCALQGLIDLLQHHSGASRAALQKFQRARERAELLLHEATGRVPAADSADLAGVLPPERLAVKVVEEVSSNTKEEGSAKLRNSWAHVWGRYLLLGWRFSWPPSVEPPATILVVCAGVAVNVRSSLRGGELLVQASCRLPGGGGGPLTLCVVGGTLVRHQCEVDPHRLPWLHGEALPPRLALWSLVATQPRCHLVAPATASWKLASLEGLTRLPNGLYACCDGTSPLFQASVEVVPESSRLCLRAQDKEQLSFFEHWLRQQLLGSGESAARTCSPTVQARLAELLRREAQHVHALLQEPYIQVRRALHSVEWQTDFFAQLVADKA